MDVAGATRWSPDRVFSRAAMLDTLSQHYGPIQRTTKESSAPADRYVLPDGTTFGIIASTTEPFCRECDRSRLSADGHWFLCLYATEGLDLRSQLRSGSSDQEVLATIQSRWSRRQDRGAEQRLAVPQRGTFVPLEALKSHPHWEMHKRGG
jgi:cyclic pyranopterin phosphate synthase